MAGVISMLCSVLAGHPPLVWLAIYVLAGLCVALSLMVNAAQQAKAAEA